MNHHYFKKKKVNKKDLNENFNNYWFLRRNINENNKCGDKKLNNWWSENLAKGEKFKNQLNLIEIIKSFLIRATNLYLILIA